MRPGQPGGEGAEQEVFQACFIGVDPTAQETGQYIQRDGKDFKTQEDGHQVGPGSRITSYNVCYTKLLRIDEEHRFGVKDKERLKQLRADVDVLTLTATPIPRTLNMALGGLRDLSLITTAPAARLAIKTFVSQWNGPMVREACLREIRRGGQIYYVHNSIETIEKTARALAELVPEVV